MSRADFDVPMLAYGIGLVLLLGLILWLERKAIDEFFKRELRDMHDEDDTP